MNRAPYLLPNARFGYRLGDGELVDSTVDDGLWCAIEDCHMGTHAERVAITDHVSREDQDAFALESHRRAIAAIDAGRFDAELAPVTVRDAKGRETIVVDRRGPAARLDRRGARPAEARPSTCRPARTAATRRTGHRHRRQRARHHRRRGGDGRRQRAGRRAATASSRSPGSSATPRPRSRRSGCSSPRSRASAACSTGSSCRSRRSTSSRSTRRSRPRSSPTAASSGSTGTRSTSTAARSRSATRSGRAARGSSRRSSTSCSRREGRYGLATLCLGGGGSVAMAFERVA